MALTGEPTPRETYDALETILGDEETFQAVVQSVFKSMDKNGNGSLEAKELGEFLSVVCGDIGAAAPPTSNQVLHVFKHLDLNGDNCVSRDELEVFLRHLFTEQMGQAKDKLARAKAAAAGEASKAGAGAAKPAGSPLKKATGLWGAAMGRR